VQVGNREVDRFQPHREGRLTYRSCTSGDVHPPIRTAFGWDFPVVIRVCRKAGISEATFCNWRKRYAGLMPSEVKRLRQLEEEIGKLKRIVADLSLDKAMLHDVLQKML
jgi:putative transposase